MKLFSTLLSLLAFVSPLQAKIMSACEHACFEQKYQCNINKSHTYNTCNEDLLGCRLGCTDNKRHNADSGEAFPLNVSFRPTLKLEGQALAGLVRKWHQ